MFAQFGAQIVQQQAFVVVAMLEAVLVDVRLALRQAETPGFDRTSVDHASLGSTEIKISFRKEFKS